MLIKIHPSLLNGTVHAPTSKSMMQRACAAALLKKGRSIILNPGKCNDDKAALAIIQNLGAKVQFGENNLIIDSQGVNPVTTNIDCLESGLSTRMFTTIASLSNQQLVINGSGSLLKRPMDFFENVFPKLSVHIETQDGKLPFRIKGPLQPRSINIDGSLSSQYLTGLLLAISSLELNEPIEIKVENLKSKPYVDLTLTVIESFGLNMPIHKNYENFTFSSDYRSHSSREIQYTVEGDWSSAAFLLVAGAISGNITIKGLDVFSLQGDKSILQVLMSSGCLISIEPSQIEIRKSKLKPFYFDATDSPDLFPPLVALAAYCDGKSVIKGTERLTYKESNRTLTLQNEFLKMGVEILIQDDLMIIEGGHKIKGAVFNSHGDHRIAMACAIAALGAEEFSTIENADAVNKSFPDFFNHLKQLGANIQNYNPKNEQLR